MIRWVCALILLPFMAAAQSTTLQIEQQLAAIGINTGSVDGVADAQTTAAIKDFQYNFGFAVTGTLASRDVKFLTQVEYFSKQSGPFVIAEDRVQISERKNLFRSGGFARFPRRVYANGPHFLAERGHFQSNPAHNSLSSSFTTPAMNAGRERSQYWTAAANEWAAHSGNHLSAALLALSDYVDGDMALPETLQALEVVLAQARAAPQETALVAALVRGVMVRLRGKGFCRFEETEAFPVLEQIVTVVEASNLDAVLWSSLLRTTIECAPPEKRDMYYRALLDMAQNVSHADVTATQFDWARDAHSRRDSEIARPLFAKAAQRVLAGGALPSMDMSHAWNQIVFSENIVAMSELGMSNEIAQLGLRRVGIIEKAAVVPIDASFASTSNYKGLFSDTSLLFLETRQFDLLRRLGQYLAQPELDQYRGRWNMMSESNAIWEIALVGLRSLAASEAHERIVDLIASVLPEVLKDRENPQAFEIAMLRAEAAMVLGEYIEAERSLVQAVTLGQLVGITDETSEKIATIRRALNLSHLDDLPPTKKFLSQIEVYYSDFCETGADAKEGFWFYPNVDFEAIAEDGNVWDAIVSSNVMNRILGCDIARKMTNTEARTICAIAAISGRKDVVDYILNGEIPGVEIWRRYGPIESCAYGLSDAGQFEWFRLSRPPTGDTLVERNIRFLSLSSAERQAVAARSDIADLKDGEGWIVIPIPYLERDLPKAERQEVLEQFRRIFGALYGRMGPTESVYLEEANRASAYRRMGLFGAAEAQLFIGGVVDPFDFGNEPVETLRENLLVPGAIQNRVEYAKLYRAQGDFDRAYAVIGPITELAISRMASDADPLPGTVEQWSKRFESLFSIYLELQFDGLSSGTNYPVIFAIQQYLQLANSTASSSVLEQRLNSASPDVARKYQDTRRALRAAMRDPKDGDLTVGELNQTLRALEAQLPDKDAALQSHQIGVTRKLNSVALELRKTGATLIVLSQLPRTLVVMYVNGAGATARRLNVSRREAQSTVDIFRRSLLESTADRDVFDSAQAARLYEDLIGWGHEGAAPPENLRLVMDGPFSTIPVGALRSGEVWLGATSALRVSPSVANAVAGQRGAGSSGGFVGVGDPNLTDGDTVGRRILLGDGVYLDELPETAAELSFMAIAFGGDPTKDVFTRAAATERNIFRLNEENRLADTRVLALATHGLLSRETGTLNSAGLVLSLPTSQNSDGILTASEIFRLRIGADLVILSACNTGTPGAGAGLSELASAFLYAGAGTLLLTHWEVDSGASVELMKRVSVGYRADSEADYSSLLRQAVNEILSDESLKKFHHPRFWASHFVLG